MTTPAGLIILKRRPRNFDRANALYRARFPVEDDLAGVTLKHFRKAWRRIIPEVRRLKKQIAGYPWWDGWRTEYELEFRENLARGAEQFLEIEGDWYRERGRGNILYDPDLVLDSYDIGTRIQWITNTTLKITDSIIRDWYGTDKGMPDLVSRLALIYGEYRAKLIGITETTFLASAVSTDMMRAGGLDRWWWRTRKDDIVCNLCNVFSAAGPYTLRDARPPDNSHPGCRCGMSPIVE